ncbi:MAG TPA: TadE/TadG family type IV pilus assembly protein [Roseiarcus sp.]|nr:TadE/TadG family type IV pilus assembly protein [Roseiarcus sp.]
MQRGVGERAIAATEFALILPVALIVFTGALIYGTASEVNRKVALTARDVTDLVTQYESLTLADMTTLINSAAQVLTPFPSSNAVVIVSEVTMNSSGQGTITWSASSSNGTPFTQGASVTLPTNIQAIPNATSQTSLSLIWGHVTYVYTPTIGYQLTGPIVLYDDIYLQPRLSATVSYPAATTTP